MAKNRKWQTFLIAAVMALTFYHILPTLFYYTKPLKENVTEEQGRSIALQMEKRVNQLEQEAIEWVGSYCKTLRIQPASISIDPSHPQNITVRFNQLEEATVFKSRLPRAGSLISFAPARFVGVSGEGKEVLVRRQIPLHFEAQMLTYVKRGSEAYQNLLLERAAQIASLLGNGNLNVKNSLKNGAFSEISYDAEKGIVLLRPLPDAKEEKIIEEIAKIKKLCNETVESEDSIYKINLQKPQVTSLLVLDLEKVGNLQIEALLETLRSRWHPTHPDLAAMEISANDLESKTAPALVIHNPLTHSEPHFNPHSLYLSLFGLERLAESYEQFPDSELAQKFRADLDALVQILRDEGFIQTYGKGILFEKPHFARMLLAATREHFITQGNQKYAVLELTNLEERILTENRIETAIHEDLIKWHEEYQAAQVSFNEQLKFDIPKPTRNLLLSNLSLSLKKWMRGDEKNVIRWGLDLSGGKTVQIELRDANHKVVTEDADIRQGINELYNRVNKMGISEVSIRQVENRITLDFPGSQALSASELIQSSTMYFHVVNEKFSSHNSSLAEPLYRFLNAVWNEALVKEKTDPKSVERIAYRHLMGEGGVRSESAQALWDEGLRLQSPDEPSHTNAIDETISKVVVYRGTDHEDWHWQSHPLLIVFRNFALEGSQLTNIHAAYDPSKGNYLSFEVDNASSLRPGQTLPPQTALHTWTSRFSKESISGTPLAAYSRGQGWRMAVVLNDQVISAPTLDSALTHSAMISGSFSQREVQKLAADLKAGSLTFTPHILSEKNVSPELGQADRMKGITATAMALVLVIASMVLYYRFAGWIASAAVIFNLLILWATLQNLGATLTLGGIAGIILTVGMAVDANVLVFERIKEEFSHSGSIASAIQAGYKKAYSAIIDSNVTTILAALILLNFDAGPIKSFAVNLIIGIASSMFTALFMTRFYFNIWLQNPKHKILKMANWIQGSSFNFLSRAKIAFAAALSIILVGGYFLFAQSSSILGMDFTGGFSFDIELKPQETHRPLELAQQQLAKTGLDAGEFQVRELDSPHHLRLLLASSLEQPGKPFAGLGMETDTYTYHANPRIDWVLGVLSQTGLQLTPTSLAEIDHNWTAMSGQMSDAMRNHALLGLLLSLVAIFIYLAFRFEYKFSAAALICLLHDVFITLGCIGLLHALRVPIQIDLNTVAAIMTIVGYSLNDTIIIFDRIREEIDRFPNRKLSDIVNSSLNATLSRTTITSGTTLLVLIALVLFGGSSIFSFALVMTIGVFFGTLSSWFIASPLLLFFHARETKAELKV